MIELGRYIVGECGVYVTEVVDRKVSRGHRPTSSSTAACTTSSPRPATSARSIRRNYPLAVGNRVDEPAGDAVTVVGCLCTPLDLLGDDVALPPADIGDLDRDLPGGRLRPHRQPDRVPRPPRARRGARLNQTSRRRRTAMTDTVDAVREVLDRHAGASQAPPSSPGDTALFGALPGARLLRRRAAGRSRSRIASTSSSTTRSSAPTCSRRSGSLTDFVDSKLAAYAMSVPAALPGVLRRDAGGFLRRRSCRVGEPPELDAGAVRLAHWGLDPARPRGTLALSRVACTSRGAVAAAEIAASDGDRPCGSHPSAAAVRGCEH